MNANILATADALSDQELLTRIPVLAGREREAATELVAHLAVLDTRPVLYAAKGHGSLFRYCTDALGLSEDAACNRVAVARACRRFPVILDLLASGSVTQTSVRLLAKYLTAENHQAVLARASRRNRDAIDALVAELGPQPDMRASVRKLPTFTAPPASRATPTRAATSAPAEPAPAIPSAAVLAATPRTVVRASAPQRYCMQFTTGQETHEKVRRVQALLRREIPDGDLGAIFDRAISLLLDTVEKGSSGRPPGSADTRLSVPGRIRTSGNALGLRGISRGRSSVQSGSATEASAPSWLPKDGDARSERSWSSTTSSPMRNRGRPRSRTFPFGVGATTSTRPS